MGKIVGLIVEAEPEVVEPEVVEAEQVEAEDQEEKPAPKPKKNSGK